MLRTTINLARCFIAGFRDGWRQPHNLIFSTNVEWLLGDDMYDVPTGYVGYSDKWQEALDRGINLGQRVRSPFHYQKD